MEQSNIILDTPFGDSKVDNIVDQNGVVEELPVLNINLKNDKEFIYNLEKRIKDSQDYWNDTKGFNLKVSRAENYNMYLGRQIDTTKLYTYQVPYVDNELLVGTETIIAYVCAKAPTPEIIPQDESEASNIFAQKLQTALEIHSQKYNLSKKFEGAVRNLYLKRLGVIKLEWDDYDKDIKPIVVNPENIVLDKNCRLGEEPEFIAESKHCSVEDLFARFPEKKQDIIDELGRKRITNKLLSEQIIYKEVWFTQYNDNYEKEEAVAWYFGQLMLSCIKNPNYLYEEKGVEAKNFLDRATKPYVFFNYMNDGSHLIDQTSPFEQAIPVQKLLNKRGRQIVENADTANGVKVFKSGSISAEDVTNITGDPNEKLLLKTEAGEPLSSAYGVIDPVMLPAYVINDKTDLKNTIHNILGTPSQFRGSDDSQTSTLGEAQMIQGQASGRQEAIIRNIELSSTRYFNLLLQMMKVWYTEPKNFISKTEDGDFNKIELSRETIPYNAEVLVQEGSTQKDSIQRRQNNALNMAKLGIIDPYNFYKDFGIKNPDKRFEALLKFQTDPISLGKDIASNTTDEEAYIHFVNIANGREVELGTNVTPAHIEEHRKQMLSNRFLYEFTQEQQQALVRHIQGELNQLKYSTQLEELANKGTMFDPELPIPTQPQGIQEILNSVNPQGIAGQIPQMQQQVGMPQQGIAPETAQNAPQGTQAPQPAQTTNGAVNGTGMPEIPQVEQPQMPEQQIGL